MDYKGFQGITEDNKGLQLTRVYWGLQEITRVYWGSHRNIKRPSHGKLKLANSCWQTQVGVCERHKNSRQTRWQTVGDK